MCPCLSLQTEFIIDATLIIATEGWKILPQYVFNIESGEWLHHTTVSLTEMKSLNRISYDTGEFKSNQEPWSAKKAFTMGNTILKAKDVIRCIPIAYHIHVRNIRANSIRVIWLRKVDS